MLQYSFFNTKKFLMSVKKKQFSLAVLLSSIALVGFILFYGCDLEQTVVPSAESLSVEKGGTKIYAVLLGENENTGDPTGTGTAIFYLNQGLGEISYEISVSNLSSLPTLSHIHLAPPGVPGPAVVHLTPPSETTGFSSGTIENVDRELIKNIRMNPSDYYVNVHTADLPAGAIRGQLMR